MGSLSRRKRKGSRKGSRKDSTAKPPTAKPPTAKPPTAKPPTAKPPTAKPPTAKPPCSFCTPLVRNGFLGDPKTVVVSAEAADSGCPICGVFFTAACIFLPNTDSIITLNTADPPLQLNCYEGHFYLVDFITTSALAEPFTQFKPTPLIAKHSDEPQCFVQIRDWMTVCDASHEDCKGPVSVRLPTRVIDVNPTVDGLRPVLVNANGALGQYVALSYSWGAGLPLKLTRSSLASLMSGIPWTDISKTLQDAMTITHKLGLRYLWIDALTIIQDDEDDWHTEASKMAMVYGNAHVTIAATHSQDLDAGIFAPRDFPTTYYRVWPLPGQFTTKPTPVEELHDGEIYARNSPRPILDSHPLQKRGWTLQEHILSRRVIQYTEDQIVWHCRTARATEVDARMKRSARRKFLSPAVLPPRSEIDAATRDRLCLYWTHIVEDYSARKLTRESDKLVAISGVADALSASGMGPHHAGVFESDPLFQLAWCSRLMNPDGQWAPTHVRPARYRAPSWSWASVDGHIRWNFISYPHYLRAPLAQCRVVRLSDTELVLRGKQIPGVLTKTSSYLPMDPGYPGYNKRGGVYFHCRRSHLVVSDNQIERPHTDIIDTTPMHPGVAPPTGLPKLPLGVICLQLGIRSAGYVLVLILTRSSTHAAAYERVGIDFEFNEKHFVGIEETEVTIV